MLEFVAESGLSKAKGEAGRLVRSHAARAREHGRTQNRNLASKRVPSQLPLLRPNNRLERRQDPLNPTAYEPRGDVVRRNMSRLNFSPAGNHVDPFDMLPIGSRGNPQYIIMQFQTSLIFSPCLSSPIRPDAQKRGFLAYALSDPALLHAWLASIAKALCTLCGLDLHSDIDYHVGRAISIVNKRIANSNHTPITKETIMAVTYLTNVGFIDPSSLQIHLNGLEALVNSNDGVKALTSHPLSWRFTSLIDILCSIAMDSKPRFEHLAPPFTYQDSAHLEPLNPLAERYKLKLSTLTGQSDTAQELIELHRILRHLIAVEKTPAAMAEVPESYRDKALHRLLALSQHPCPPLNQNALIYKLFATAALAYTVLFFATGISWFRLYSYRYSASRMPGSVGRASSRIRATLETICLEKFLLAYPEMMIWIIMIGGMTAVKDEAGWFVERLAMACAGQRISRMKELKIVLEEWLWTDWYLREDFRGFWDAVGLSEMVPL
ncbi:hypothetical protein N431DRAFT_175373 [Stipitochalara longipes BDJ]|nr:hypothetical protein N431DRAFT_175373 [Stipitochalara longipes BDJ]